MVSAAVRELADLLASTVYATVPFPLSLPPAVIVIQLASLAAPQPQPVDEATVALPVPPALP